MQCEEQRDEQARAHASGYCDEQQINQNCIRDMDDYARQVMTRRIHAEERNIKRMREPSDGMPICVLGRRECPLDGVGSQAVADMRIFRDVAIIVVVHERMLVH